MLVCTQIYRERERDACIHTYVHIHGCDTIIPSYICTMYTNTYTYMQISRHTSFSTSVYTYAYQASHRESSSKSRTEGPSQCPPFSFSAPRAVAPQEETPVPCRLEAVSPMSKAPRLRWMPKALVVLPLIPLISPDNPSWA